MDDAGTCAGIRPQLGVYLTGAIAPADRVVVVRHLAACDGCRAELAGLAGLPALLRRPPVQAAAQAPPADNTVPDNTVTYYPGAGYPGAGYPGAGRRPGRLARRMARRRRRRWLLVAAAFVLVVAAGAGWALHLIGPSGPGPQAEATMLQTRTIGEVTVLTDDEGYTLYWFGPAGRSRPPTTGIRCTPRPRTPARARPRATTYGPTGANGTRSPSRAGRADQRLGIREARPVRYSWIGGGQPGTFREKIRAVGHTAR